MQKLDLSSLNEVDNQQINGTSAVHSMLDENNSMSQNHDLLSANNQQNTDMKKTKITLFIAIIIAIIAGTGTGYGASRLKAKGGVANLGSGGSAPIQQVATDKVNIGDVFGVQDAQTFKDSAEGYLQKGNIDDEGSHQLLRPGGISQTVYLVSSVTDLDKFDGMQIKVWGETFKGQKAGWLMDVGRVEIVDPSASAPIEE